MEELSNDEGAILSEITKENRYTVSAKDAPC